MALNAGYAECINAGKTQRNEDQAAARMMSLIQACNEVKAENGDERCKRLILTSFLITNLFLETRNMTMILYRLGQVIR